MKIIGIDKNKKGADGQMKMFLMADSSILLNNKPFFVPDFAPSFKLHAAMAVRIGRLGKNIATRFASRYYQQVAACAVVEAQGVDVNEFDARAIAFDGSLMLGDFLPIKELEGSNLEVKAHIDGKCVAQASVQDMRQSIDELVALASNYFTLKMGDLLIIGADQNEGHTLSIGEKLEATIAGRESLKMRIK